jgi:ArsR family transcriptional regulator
MPSDSLYRWRSFEEAEGMDSSDVKAFFDEVATDWDEMRAGFYNARVIDALSERVGVGSDWTVLDVGTGTGFVASGLAAETGMVIGLDNSEPMLRVARDNVASLGIDNVRVVQAELTELPVRDGHADGAVANMVLHHAPDPAAMLAELRRVVKPGGVVAVTDEVAHRYEWMRTEQADIWLGFTKRDVRGFFEEAGLREHGYARLGMQ